MINSFRGERRWLSNFHDCHIYYAGLDFLNSESAYQAMKFLDPAVRKQFTVTSGKEAKALAKKLDHLKRRDWLQVNLGFMSEIIHVKFTQNKDLRELLMLTYPEELIEGNNWHDCFWGVCDGTCLHPHVPVGENWLGRILMSERVYWLDLSSKDHYKDDRLVKPFEDQQRRQGAA